MEHRKQIRTKRLVIREPVVQGQFLLELDPLLRLLGHGTCLAGALSVCRRVVLVDHWLLPRQFQAVLPQQL